MKNFFKFFFTGWPLLFSSQLLALEDKEQVLGKTEERIESLKLKITKAQKSVFALSKKYHHRSLLSPYKARPVWQNFKGDRLKQNSELNWLKALVEQRRENLKSLKNELLYLEGEFSWLAKGSFKKRLKRCELFPFSQQIDRQTKKLKDFGDRQKLSTGFQLQSTGWLLELADASVRACRGGKLSYLGKVEGKGYLVMIDHGYDFVSIYAQLKEVSDELQAGQKWIRAGQHLGRTKNNFYFELRMRDQPLDPALGFAKSTIKNIFKAR